METLNLLSIPKTKLEITTNDQVNTTYLNRLNYIKKYAELINTEILYPFLTNDLLRKELYIKNTAVGLQIKKLDSTRENITKLKNIVEKELKNILYNNRHSAENKVVIFLEEFSLSLLSIYIKKPQKQATILTKTDSPLKITAIEFILRNIEEEPEPIIKIIEKIASIKKNYKQTLEKLVKNFNIKDQTFSKNNTVIKVKNQKVEINSCPIREFHNNSCKEITNKNIEDKPSDISSIKKEIKLLKIHMKSILKRNYTKSINALPPEDKEDFIYTYRKYKKLVEKIKLEKLRYKKDGKDNTTTTVKN